MSQPVKRVPLTLNKQKISVIETLTTKYYEVLKEQKDLRLISYDDLARFFDEPELTVIDELYKADAKQFGFKGEFVGVDSVPDDLAEIPSASFVLEGEKKQTGVQYLPKNVLDKVNLMKSTMEEDGAGSVLINSAYRSPAYQALLFLSYLRRNNYDINLTASRVALPGYSQHGSANRPAIDFITPDGIPSSKNGVRFETTPQYQWLTQHANRYNFYLSYPKNNPHGVIFEPWHWQYIPKT